MNKIEDNLEKKVNNVVLNSIESIKEKIRNDFKGLEKDHITILGIFVAIVLAFIGSIIIPTKFLESATTIGFAKLILLFNGTVFVFINMLYLLIKFIVIINDKVEHLEKLSYIRYINYALLTIFALSAVCVFFTDNITDLQQKVLDNIISSKQ